MSRRLPAPFALLVAVLLVASPLAVGAASTATYHHDIEPVSQSDVPERATVRHYDALSADAQSAIDDALHGDGVIAGEANKPAEFFYSDYARLGQGIYYVEKGGTYYRLSTLSGGGLVFFGPVLNALAIVLGVGIGFVGWLSLRQERRWLPLAVGALGLGYLFVRATGPVDNWQFVAVGWGVVSVMAAAVAGGWAGPTRTVWRAIATLTAVIGALAVVLFVPAGPVELSALPLSPVTLGFLVVVVLALAGGHLGSVVVRRATEE